MIVDDNALMRSTIRRSLKHSADEFCECNDGIDALTAYTKFRPDWVLMDIKMKQMDGIKAAREILSSFPDAKIIMVTQHNETTLYDQAREAGAIDFVLKDNLADIERIIQSHHH